jgi:hypothetical protein
LEAAIVAISQFTIDQQSQAFIKREAMEFGLLELLGKGLGHPGEAQ